MKRVILFIQIFPLLFLFSCDGGKRTYASYELLNSSGYLVKIKVYNNVDDLGLTDSLLLNNSDRWESVEFETSKGIDSPVVILNGDSLLIQFNNSKQLVHSTHTIFDKGNILNTGSYEIVILDKIKTRYRYTFTEEDYNNAEKIVDGG